MDDPGQVENGRPLGARAQAADGGRVADVPLDQLEVGVAGEDRLRIGSRQDQAANALEARLLGLRRVVRVGLVQEVQQPVAEPARVAGDER